MRAITDIAEMKTIQLEIMQKVHNFCEANGITYFLSHGSLIGALRHQGFIPWDDDIDIFMPREDYNSFCKRFPREQQNLCLRIVNANTDIYYGRPMTKVINTNTYLIEPNYLFDDGIGINIDIWPLDGVPNTEREKKIRLQKITLLINIMYARILKYDACRNIRDKIAHIATLPLSAKKLVQRINTELETISFSEASIVSCYVDPYKKEFEKTWFKTRRLVPFEDKSFFIPGGAEQVLTTLYGDYMQLPPLEKRKPHHITNAFWKDDMNY